MTAHYGVDPAALLDLRRFRRHRLTPTGRAACRRPGCGPRPAGFDGVSRSCLMSRCPRPTPAACWTCRPPAPRARPAAGARQAAGNTDGADRAGSTGPSIADDPAASPAVAASRCPCDRLSAVRIARFATLPEPDQSALLLAAVADGPDLPASASRGGLAVCAALRRPRLALGHGRPVPWLLFAIPWSVPPSLLLHAFARSALRRPASSPDPCHDHRDLRAWHPWARRRA